ncbi:MAG: hypothetical protein JW913_13590 [Chitinispirillaceae bacterium]|nr:hypothetical protein [Chitinispirillaceae bacterium]
MKHFCRIISYLLAVTFFAAVISGHSDAASSSDALSALKTWLTGDYTQRPSITQQPFSSQPLTKEEADSARQLLLNDHFERKKTELASEWQNKTMQSGTFRMKFDYRTFGQKPVGGRSLFISMHGGGNAPAATNDEQWENQITLYRPPEGIYLSPRAPTDTWNMWFQDNVDPLFKKIIQAAVVFLDVNPNRVYLMGYSAGGDGAYQMGPRMADYWAAAAAMAGHPNEASPLNLRNIGFTVHVGELDDAYDRNTVALEWKRKLDSLRNLDPEGYVHEVRVHAGLPHWMNLEDSVAIPWMMRFTRNTTPDRLVWKQSDVPCTTFYWLSVPSSSARKNNEMVVQRSDQEITIDRFSGVKMVTLYFNDSLLDMEREVRVRSNEKILFTGMIPRTIGTMYTTLAARSDRDMVFDGQLTVDLARGTVPVASRRQKGLMDHQFTITINGKPTTLNYPISRRSTTVSIYAPDGRLLFTGPLRAGPSCRGDIPVHHRRGCLIIRLDDGVREATFRTVRGGY